MRRRLTLVFLLLGAACGASEPSVTDRIDALRRGGMRFTVWELPSPARMAELHPDRQADGPPSSRLRYRADAAAILDAGASAVPELTRLLGDADRRTIATAILGEIGGAPAATALLAQWRGHRDAMSRKAVKHFLGDDTNIIGQRYEPDDQGFYAEVIFALCYTGRYVSAEIARDASAAMDEVARLQVAGDELDRREKRSEPAGEVELFWDVEPVETACEGLHILGMAGADEGPALFARALRSPVGAIRWAALRDVIFLGRGQETTLPALAPLLDDAKFRDDAVGAVAEILDRAPVSFSATPAERVELVARYRKRLQELGYLPR